jgi:hypothetical protein
MRTTHPIRPRCVAHCNYIETSAPRPLAPTSLAAPRPAAAADTLTRGAHTAIPDPEKPESRKPSRVTIGERFALCRLPVLQRYLPGIVRTFCARAAGPAIGQQQTAA